MREFFELVNEYPWTTVGLIIGSCWLLEALGKAIHGPKNTIIINPDKKDRKEYET
jgi:hypothetical protein